MARVDVRVSLVRTLAFFLPPAKALAALAAFDSGAFGGIFRSCATRATERRHRSRARHLEGEGVRARVDAIDRWGTRCALLVLVLLSIRERARALVFM